MDPEAPDADGLDLDNLRHRAAEATPGPWEAWQNTSVAEYEVSQTGRRFFGLVASPSRGVEDYGRANAEFIAAANPQAIVALLDRLGHGRGQSGLRDGARRVR